MDDPQVDSYPLPDENESVRQNFRGTGKNNPYLHHPAKGTLLPRKFGGRPRRCERLKEELVSDMMGSENMAETMARFHGIPQRVSELLPQVISQRLRRPNMAFFAALEARWEYIAVTPFNARQSAPLHITGTTLEIEVSNASLLYAFNAPNIRNEILRRIQEIDGGSRITALRFVAAGRR